MEKSMVTAIITTRNRKELLKKAIQSVKNQTYKNIELLVIDDGSTDGTIEFLKKENIKFISIPKNESKGGNYARNLGVKNSNGDFVAFLDDDDEWMPEKIEKQMKVIQNDNKIGIVACAKVYEFNFCKKKKQKKGELIRGDLSKKIFTCIPYSTSCLLMNKKLLIENELFDENLKAWQEYELEIRLSQITNIETVKDYLVLYRVIKTDKNRITNNLAGWEESVKYIENKHNELIKKLPLKIQRKHKALIAKDGAKRAGRIGNTKLQKLYLKDALKNEVSIKNFIKYTMNISRLRG